MGNETLPTLACHRFRHAEIFDDTSVPTKLAPGSVTYDKYPDGHVSVQPPPINSIEDLKRAVVGDKGKMQR
jgi:hypothetical protein